MRLPDLHREVLDPHLQWGHPVHRLHKVSSLSPAAQGSAWASENPLHLPGEFKGDFPAWVLRPNASQQRVHSRESQRWVGACRPRCSGNPWGHIILPGRLGLSKCFALQFNPESQAETPKVPLAACLPPARGARASQRDGPHNTVHPATTDRIGLSRSSRDLSKPAGWQWQGPSLSHPADCPLCPTGTRVATSTSSGATNASP